MPTSWPPRARANAFLLSCFCLAASAVAFASVAESEPARVVYTAPRAGTRFARPEAGLVFRFDRALAPAERAVSLAVTGSRSGAHEGTTRFASDGRTLVFRPGEPFVWGESVHVVLDGPALAAGDPRATLDFGTGAGPGLPRRPMDGEDADPMRPLYAAGDAVLPATPAIADDLPVLTPTVTGTPAPGLLFLGMYTWSGLLTPYMLILDNAGTPVFQREGAVTDFKLQPNGLITYFDLAAAKFYAMDSTYTVVDSFQCANGYDTDAHELLLLPGGHALLLGIDSQIVDMTSIVPGGYPETTVLGQVIQELDADKLPVFEWTSWDHYEITDATHENYQSAYLDYVHANALDLDDDNTLLMSARHMDEVTKIDRATGDIVWRWGGKHNQFAFLGDTMPFSHQHAIRRLENGHYILFDNGNFHSPQFSRAAEYALDQDAKTAELVWQYRTVPDTYGAAMGNAQRLPNGSTLVCWGIGSPEITEVTADGDPVMTLTLPGAYTTYRTFRQEWPPSATASVPHGSGTLALSANLPNPFRDRTGLFLSLPAPGTVSARVYDTQGRLVSNVLDAVPYGAGVYRIQVDLGGKAAGVYFCRVTTAAGEVTRRLVKVR